MELRHLRYFVAVAEERSFSRAAIRLAIAQPPLSQQVRRLETELGFPLFDRTPAGVMLTRAGEALLVHARAVLLAATEAAAAADAAHRGSAGRLTLGFINGAAYGVLPRVLRAYRAAHPDVELVVREMIIADQLDALVNGGIDAGILRPPVADRRLAACTLASERFVAAVPADHALAAHAGVALRDLAQVPLVSYPAGHPAGFREQIDTAFRALGITPRYVQQATQLHTICGLVAGGFGMAIVPAGARSLQLEGLAFVPLRGFAMRAEITLAWRKARDLPQLDQLVAVARVLRPGGKR